LSLLAEVLVEKDNPEEALDFAHRAVDKARKRHGDAHEYLPHCLRLKADILESLGRLDEALALDAEWRALKPGERHVCIDMRSAMKHMADGEVAEAERLLRRCACSCPLPHGAHKKDSIKTIEAEKRPHIMLAELLEGKGTEEALAEARMRRDRVAQLFAAHKARRAAALEETRAAAAEAVRQWREERSKTREEKKGGKGKKKRKKKKGKKGKAKGKGPAPATAVEGEEPREQAGGEAKGTTVAEAETEGASPAVATEGEQPYDPAGGHAKGAAAVEGAAAAEIEQQASGGGSQPPAEEKEEEREECAVCLFELVAEDDEDPWGDSEG
jgi:hypothetical protein